MNQDQLKQITDECAREAEAVRAETAERIDALHKMAAQVMTGIESDIAAITAEAEKRVRAVRDRMIEACEQFKATSGGQHRTNQD